MDLRKYMAVPGEKPLDNIPADGGFAAIFRTIACVGDSLTSGEMQVIDEKGVNHYYDQFEHSWGQYLGRMLGSQTYVFSRGGMTAIEYMKTWAEENRCWDKDKAALAYIVALGVNDVSWILRNELEFGSVSDVKDAWQDNGRTFCGYYAAIIQRYKEISPDGKFFLMTMPAMTGTDIERFRLYDRHQAFLHELAQKFSNTYVLDLRAYAPVYDDAFRRNFMLNGHLNPAGYLLTAKMTAAYIDYIIRNNPDDFRELGMANTGIKNHKKQ